MDFLLSEFTEIIELHSINVKNRSIYTSHNNKRTKLLFLFAGCPANLIPKLLL